MSYEKLGENIKTVRKLKKMKQQELANAIGINLQSLSKIERGVNYPTYKTLEKIMLVLEVTPNELLSLEYKEIDNKGRKECSLKYIMSFLSEYDNIYIEDDDKDYVGVICELLVYLRCLPNSLYVFEGAYHHSQYKTAESELFYIKDMIIFRHLLKGKNYKSFIHELCDFLLLKIMQDDINSDVKLPANIKYALIDLIEKDFKG